MEPSDVDALMLIQIEIMTLIVCQIPSGLQHTYPVCTFAVYYKTGSNPPIPIILDKNMDAMVSIMEKGFLVGDYTMDLKIYREIQSKTAMELTKL